MPSIVITEPYPYSAHLLREQQLSFYVARGSSRNQFRPIFSAKADMLKGSTAEDIRKYPRLSRPPPKHPPRRRKAKKKDNKKKRRYMHNGRKPVNVKKDNTPVRNLKDATRTDHEYRKNHPVKTLTVGSVKASIVRNGTLDASDAEAISQQLRVAVVVLNRLRHYAYWAMALDIMRILE
jgi:hypothetical protein